MLTQFMGKSWIYIPQAVTAGFMGLFSLILGLLFLFGFMTNADGTPAPDAGLALSITSVFLLPVFALAMYNLRARRQTTTIRNLVSFLLTQTFICNCFSNPIACESNHQSPDRHSRAQEATTGSALKTCTRSSGHSGQSP